MSSRDIVMIIHRPGFTVRLHRSYLEFDLEEGARKKLEDVLEADPTIRDSLGFLFQHIIPLDVPLADVEAVKHDDKGKIRIVIPHRRDVTIPLEPDEAKELVHRLNELIPIEKQRKLEHLLADQEVAKKISREQAFGRRH